MNKNAAFLFSALFLIFFSSIVQANNLTVSNVQLGPRDPSSKTLSVLFDVSWENSWRNKINHDALWLTVRLHDTQAAVTDRRLCQMPLAGTTPTGTSVGSASGLEIYVPEDKLGAFLRRSQNAEIGSVSSTSVKLTVDYSSCGFSEDSQIGVTVFGLEMVLVPQGSFYAGDFATSSYSFRQGSADNDPWEIQAEAALSVTGAAADGYYYVSAGNPGEFSTGAAFTIPQDFPKGYNAFYAMKYEITEGEWVNFINSLPTAEARAQRDITDTAHKNSDVVIQRNTISCSGAPLICITQRPYRPVSFLSWKDVTAFLDWAALRPMTELEFEKMARGPFVPVKGEYAWSTTQISAAATISGLAEEGDEIISDQGANANYDSSVLSGGDTVNGPEYQSGPIRAGIFATSTSDRPTSGGGNFGNMELSGNLKEWVVSAGHLSGVAYTGVHGNGVLTAASGFEGNADVPGWPGLDVDVSRGVTSSQGAGFRGGSWADSSARLRISDRQEASSAADNAAGTYGGRGVRSLNVQ